MPSKQEYREALLNKQIEILKSELRRMRNIHLMTLSTLKQTEQLNLRYLSVIDDLAKGIKMGIKETYLEYEGKNKNE